ncbi:hypothetical protein C8R46DRAFT_1246484 [Mycena filopes]|nr:hypothetical protein C8R46DRAFT_1246484 [Mycena filopes]
MASPLADQNATETTSPDVTTPRFPREVELLVLEQMDDGSWHRNRAFQDVAFVCLAWACKIQSLLFRRLHLADDQAGRFLNLVRASKRIGTYVQVLYVALSDTVFDHPRLSSFLPNCHTFRIQAHIFQPIETMPRVWSSVTTLAFKLCFLSNAQDLWDFIDLFPALERLECLGSMTQLADPWVNVAPDTPTVHLKQLVVESGGGFTGRDSSHPVFWQLAARRMTVDRLSVTFDGEADLSLRACGVGHVAQEFADLSGGDLEGASESWRKRACKTVTLLSNTGSTLQELDIVELAGNLKPDIGIDLSTCTTLQSLTLNSTVGPAQMKAGLISLLQEISSSALTTITLNLSLSASVRELPWDDVDTILAADGLRNLKRVVIGAAPVDDDDATISIGELEAILKTKMAGIHGRGVLDFQCREREVSPPGHDSWTEFLCI